MDQEINKLEGEKVIKQLESIFENMDKSVYYLDASKWGIYSDGTHSTETTNGFNNAIQWAKSQGISHFKVPNGNYLIDTVSGLLNGSLSGIILPSNFHMELAHDAIFKVEANDYYGIGATVFNIHEVSNVRLSGGQVIGDREHHIWSVSSEFNSGGLSSTGEAILDSTKVTSDYMIFKSMKMGGYRIELTGTTQTSFDVYYYTSDNKFLSKATISNNKDINKNSVPQEATKIKIVLNTPNPSGIKAKIHAPSIRSTHEYSTLVSIISSHHILIEGLKLIDSTGDCLFSSSSRSLQYGPYNPATNIAIRNSVFDSSRRNNLSLLAHDWFVIDNCVVKNAGIKKYNVDGTAPRTGIDLEGYRETGWKQYKGKYNASTGIYPTTTPIEGDFWEIEVPGTIDGVFYGKFDMLIFEGKTWLKYEQAFSEGSSYVDFRRPENTIITNSIFTGNVQSDINCYDSHYTIIDSNRFSQGVNMSFGYGVTVSNNYFKSPSNQQSPTVPNINSSVAIIAGGIEVARSHLVVGNLIEGFAVGIFSKYHSHIISNTIRECKTAISFPEASNSKAQNNSIEFCDIGIASLISTSNIIIDSNILSDIKDTAFKFDKAKGTVVSHNIIRKTKTLLNVSSSDFSFIGNVYDGSLTPEYYKTSQLVTFAGNVNLKLIDNKFVNVSRESYQFFLTASISGEITIVGNKFLNFGNKGTSVFNIISHKTSLGDLKLKFCSNHFDLEFMADSTAIGDKNITLLWLTAYPDKNILAKITNNYCTNNGVPYSFLKSYSGSGHVKLLHNIIDGGKLALHANDTIQ